MQKILISRRQLLQRCGAMPFLLARAQGQEGRPGTSAGELSVRLIKEFKHLELLDVSQDGSKLCCYSTRNPTRSFVWNGAWSEKKHQVREGEEALRIIDTASWNSTFAARLAGMPHSGTRFFADGKAVNVEIPGVTGGGTLHLVIDLETGAQQEYFAPYKPNGIRFSYTALGDRVLLGVGRHTQTAHTDVLVKVEASSYREIQRVAFAGERSPSTGRTEAPIAVSADRKMFVGSYDNTVVCRRSEDLQIAWTQKTDPDSYLWRLAVSADGSLAAASTTSKHGGKPYVAVFDGRDGKELTKLSANGHESVAISPDGKLLAAGQRVDFSGRNTTRVQPTVVLFDIASGKQLATLIHDQFGNYLDAEVNIFFLPDNKRLITAGVNTKVWQIGTTA